MREKVAILGTGNIGTNLLIKIQRSENLECSIFAGRNPDSDGVKIAREIGVPVSFDSIQYIVNNPDCCDIVFDATTASVHKYHAPILKKLGKFTIDLTPAHVGLFAIPAINVAEAIEQDNVNMITCGGQASVPMAYAISQVHPNVKYFELVATIASNSAGPGTRANIDEFTQATGDALSYFTKVEETKAIINLNPAIPEIIMRNTLFAVIDNPNMYDIRIAIDSMEQKIKRYVPGYKVIVPPTLEKGRIIMTMEVRGSGDYLPEYAGNLDIITCAGLQIAEEYAINKKGVNNG